ncbi:hypothetical protein M2323_004361 [Rhodoblastus acidophilus]|uniref:lytic transglycosylase domain-containing protein n=1 Tax=Rhodoblastus acidophilus TaxID=1074 RepID=UPI002225856A|nr:lytic transglycosylase domain-containing protein [Rhodoblastus acidophilus]MCW2286564.1 hypothetical protein [Rhodoblastus acidophilus]MCW2335413.1 hypothetical protein [Rhodoblastus acidophilus]
MNERAGALRLGLAIVITASASVAGAAEDRDMRRADLLTKACGEIASAARTFGLPQKFLTRLLWQESRFNPQAVSSAGAQGIAQFMPGTAQWRGLDDPFDSAQSIRHSGRWLGELRQQFGNLGLAAAAYNAGPARVQGWLAGERALPEETRDYVRIVTGRAADDWVGMRDVEDGPDKAECPPRGAVALFGATPGLAPPRALDKPKLEGSTRPGRSWALQLAGDRSKSAVLLQYADMRRQFPSILGPRAPEVAQRRLGGRGPNVWYQVRVSEASRQSASSLCERLKSAGGQCLVIRN